MALRRRRRTPAPVAPPPPLLSRWDLDKTYLRSEFDTIRQLIRTARERGVDKVEVPGVADVIKALRAAADRRGRRLLTYFISASPPQIGRAIRDKLALDGVPYDGITFKNQLANLRPGKLRHLREHVGFKLAELLRGRLAAPPDARELLFGDDWESDPLTYSLYADVLAGRLPPERVTPLLGRIGVHPDLVRDVEDLARRVAGAGAVERIFINLERRTPPGFFRLFGTRLVPTFNYFQTALVLAADGFLDAEDAATVGRALVERSGYTPRRLENSLGDLVRRGLVSPAAAERLARRLRAEALLPVVSRGPGGWLQQVIARIRGRGRPPAPGPGMPPAAALDYETILSRLRPSERAPREAV
jgi:hypothetical protein